MMREFVIPLHLHPRALCPDQIGGRKEAKGAILICYLCFLAAPGLLATILSSWLGHKPVLLLRLVGKREIVATPTENSQQSQWHGPREKVVIEAQGGLSDDVDGGRWCISGWTESTNTVPATSWRCRAVNTRRSSVRKSCPTRT